VDYGEGAGATASGDNSYISVSYYSNHPLIQKTRARDITKRRGAIKHQK
jgi:hypothetical protein